MNEQEFQEQLQEWIMEGINANSEEDRQAIVRIRTFEEAMIMTENKGLVIRLPDGSEFQVTINQSKRAKS